MFDLKFNIGSRLRGQRWPFTKLPLHRLSSDFLVPLNGKLKKLINGRHPDIPARRITVEQNVDVEDLLQIVFKQYF